MYGALVCLADIVCHFTYFAWQQTTQQALLVQFVMSWGPCIVVKFVMVSTRFLLAILKKALEMVSVSSQMCFTSNTHVVHCLSEL